MSPLLRVALATLLASLLGGFAAEARVLRVEVERRERVLEGRAFGDRGAYELLEGRVHFGFDPADPANARIADIALAERGTDGLVHAESDFSVLQAADPAKRRGTALLEVVNRGRRLALSGLNRARLDFRDATLDPSRASDFGDGFLMEAGLTLVSVGWQHDAPRIPGALKMRVPIARHPDGASIRGLARSDWVVEERTQRLELAAPGHTAHPCADPQAPENALTVRESRDGERRRVARDRWEFDATRTAILSREGFAPGRIYELVYVAEDPPVVGLGLAAIRDMALALRNDDELPFRARRVVTMGSSQAGRFLRHLLYEGLDRGEDGGRAFAGVFIHIAGAGRGGFDHRFSHPGRVANPFRNFFYPGDDFPFASRPTTDPFTGHKAGLLDHVREGDGMPRLFQLNTGYEYWGRGASLVHTTADGRTDLAPLSNERLYHLASAPHYPLPFPPTPESEIAAGIHRGSPLETSSTVRALFSRLLAWVESDEAPPPSHVPRVDGGTLVAPSEIETPLPLARIPRRPHVPRQLDFGARFEAGVVDHQPARRGPAYGLRVPRIDPQGIEEGGIRGVALRAPIASYLPWALRIGQPHFEDEMLDYLGSFAPFARTPEEREARGDPRPSLQELYGSRAGYEKRVYASIEALIAEGFLLERDRTYELEAARQRWAWITGQQPPADALR
jgi:hypothetical protein